MDTDIILTDSARRVIASLQHPNGTYTYYSGTLGRLFNLILGMSDEIGMGDTEAMSMLRVIHYLREDLASLAGVDQDPFEVNETEEDDPKEDDPEETDNESDNIHAEEQ